MESKLMAPRMCGIDALRIVSIFAVIVVHCKPLRGISNDGYVLINSACRFAVPFFFIVSGYFLSQAVHFKKKSASELAKRYLVRLGIPLLAWNFLYAFVSPKVFKTLWSADLGASCLAMGEEFVRMGKQFYYAPVTYLLIGTEYHLWFFTTLLIAVLLVLSFVYLKLTKALVYLGVVLFILFLAVDPYAATPVGVTLPFYLKNTGLLSGIFWVIMGWYLSSSNIVISKRMSLVLCLVGFVGHVAETYALPDAAGNVVPRPVVISTLPFAVGSFSLARSLYLTHASKWVELLARYTLGIYACHVIIIYAILPVFSLDLWTNQIMFPFFVFGISLFVCSLLAKIPFVKVLVT